MDKILKKITKSEQNIAKKSALALKRSVKVPRAQNKAVRIKIGAGKNYVTIPSRALEMLTIIVSVMAEGKGIYLLPANTKLTTQQAADILRVSRPHIVKLLEEGIIAYEKVGSHRRIFIDDLIRYENQLKVAREKNLNFIAQQAQELELGY